MVWICRENKRQPKAAGDVARAEYVRKEWNMVYEHIPFDF